MVSSTPSQLTDGGGHASSARPDPRSILPRNEEKKIGRVPSAEQELQGRVSQRIVVDSKYYGRAS